MDRSRRVTVAIVAAAAVAVVLFMAFGRDSGAGRKASSPTTQPLPNEVSTTALTGVAAEIRDLLVKGASTNRHAVYESKDAEGTQRLESWHRGDQTRYDTHITATDGSTTDQVLLALKDRTITCARKGTTPFVCTAIAITGTDPFTQVVSGLEGKDVARTDDTIGGRKVVCYGLTSEEGAAASLCVTPEGVPVRLQSGAAKLELILLDDDVSNVSFDPPSPPGQTPANTFTEASS